MKEGGIASRIADPYAEALISLAKDQNLTDQFGEDVSGLLSLVEESDELRLFLASPIVDSEDKKVVLQQILGEQIHPLMNNFLKLLIDNRRIAFLPEICQRYLALLRELKQAVLAKVTSVIELTEEQKQTVRDKVKQLTGASEVELETRLDPSLIGGVVIQVGSQIYDLSLRGQLRRLSLQLNSTV